MTDTALLVSSRNQNERASKGRYRTRASLAWRSQLAMRWFCISARSIGELYLFFQNKRWIDMSLLNPMETEQVCARTEMSMASSFNTIRRREVGGGPNLLCVFTHHGRGRSPIAYLRAPFHSKVPQVRRPQLVSLDTAAPRSHVVGRIVERLDGCMVTRAHGRTIARLFFRPCGLATVGRSKVGAPVELIFSWVLMGDGDGALNIPSS